MGAGPGQPTVLTVGDPYVSNDGALYPFLIPILIVFKLGGSKDGFYLPVFLGNQLLFVHL